MKLIILSLIISLSLHFIIIKSYTVKNESKKEEVLKNKQSNVKFVKLKKRVEKKEIVKPEVLEKVVKKPIIEKPKVVKKITKSKPKPKTKEVKKTVRKKVTKKQQINIKEAKKLQNKILKKQIVRKKESIQSKTLEDFLSQEEPIDKKVLSELQRLYGREYETYTKVQKAFLEKNLDNFQIITQRVLSRLGYPRLAAKLRLYGANVVEFMYYPDGSIKNLKITNSSGYAIFDEYTLELIEIAYKDYPRPKTKTKIKFNVSYRLY